jgi:ubiquinone/menaquinone biosynthesis C-methylase UbiE
MTGEVQIHDEDASKNEYSFEERYLLLRKKENRLYTDGEVGKLPAIAADHPHAAEWKMRERSTNRLVNYLGKKQPPLKILEAGCANGWLSNRLASIPGSVVIGTDVNFFELQQAARVFEECPNLHFIYGDIESGLFEEKQFDVIVFAASIQYFSSLKEILQRAMRLLKNDGELHILDSPFYAPADLESAKGRSLLYYEAMGFPEMAEWYFHHDTTSLRDFNYEILYEPGSLLNKFSRNKNPFPWIRIRL